MCNNKNNLEIVGFSSYVPFNGMISSQQRNVWLQREDLIPQDFDSTTFCREILIAYKVKTISIDSRDGTAKQNE